MNYKGGRSGCSKEVTRKVMRSSWTGLAPRVWARGVRGKQLGFSSFSWRLHMLRRGGGETNLVNADEIHPSLPSNVYSVIVKPALKLTMTRHYVKNTFQTPNLLNKKCLIRNNNCTTYKNTPLHNHHHNYRIFFLAWHNKQLENILINKIKYKPTSNI